MNSTAQHIVEKKLFENGRVFIAQTKAQDVVTVIGSVLGGDAMLPRVQTGVPLLAGRLFDAGTKKTDKDTLRDGLASRGTTLSFGTSTDRTTFSGSCLPEDLPFLLQIIAECLSEALFLEKEIEPARQRILGSIQESKTDTRTQAASELSRLLYDEQHVNYAEKDSLVEKSLTNTTRAELLNFRTLLGKGGLVLAVVGDVEPSTALKAVERTFTLLGNGTLQSSQKSKNKKAIEAREKKIAIPNKANVDLFMGTVVPLTIDSPLYLPFMTVSDMLGGGFASHLTQTVRERDGLTYGIYAWPNGFQKNVEGAFRIWSTFSPDLFEKGLETIRKEMKVFFTSGLTKSALQKKQDELAGSYVIGLSTTGGLASILHKIGVEEKPLSYIDDYPELIRAITLADIKNAAELIPYNKLSIVAAGTFAK
jgi:zinc protease